MEGPILLGDGLRVSEDDRSQGVVGRDAGVRLFPDPVPESDVDSAELHEAIVGEPTGSLIIVGRLKITNFNDE